MCGIVGLYTTKKHTPSLDQRGINRLRDRLQHRGPDDAGTFAADACVLAHRRLAVIAPQQNHPGAHQPATTPDNRYTLVYNGELYNDRQLRAQLTTQHRAHFKGNCDTETVLIALATWGHAALERFRGMYALAFYDAVEHTLLLARDPLGIKPLYYTPPGVTAPEELAFASEPTALLEHPRVSAQPDIAMVSAYLSTIRTVLDDRTMYKDIRAVRPAEALLLASPGGTLKIKQLKHWKGPPVANPDSTITIEDAARQVRQTIAGSTQPNTDGINRTERQYAKQGVGGQDENAGLVEGGFVDGGIEGEGGEGGAHNEGTSLITVTHPAGVVDQGAVPAHLRSDVPLCSLLSGGLDSTIVAWETSRSLPNPANLRTYCAGAQNDNDNEPETTSINDLRRSPPQGVDDYAFARHVAANLGVNHAEARVARAHFAERWRWMIDQLGVPLSTPNEVAIYEVAARLRADGCVVTLSGEGADELFAGYGPVMDNAHTFNSQPATKQHTITQRAAAGGMFELASNAWVAPNVKQLLLQDDIWNAAEQDAWLHETYADNFAACIDECGENALPIDAHLRFHRRINLAGLLQRLDSATMLASVEGRTPLADRVVAELAESLPMSVKYRPFDAVLSSPTPAVNTKMALRRAYAGVLPDGVLQRAKASFPMPFQEWAGDMVGVLRESPLAEAVFRREAIDELCRDPRSLWNIAWPAINLALWGR